LEHAAGVAEDTAPLWSRVAKNRAEARKDPGLGYAPDKRLAVTVSIRNVSGYRDTAVILRRGLRSVRRYRFASSA
jgi:hypothetical protein